MNKSQQKLYNLLRLFKREHDLSEIYEMVITHHYKDGVYISLIDKRDDSCFFDYDYVPIFEDFFKKMNKCAEPGHPFFHDYAVLLTDLNKIIREQKIKLVLDEK